MSATSPAERLGLRSNENPLRPRAVLAKRYTIYTLAAAILGAMTYHIFFHTTDWSRFGGLATILKETLRFVPDLTFLPQVVGPLFETLLMAFWGTFLAMFLALPITWLAARNITPFYAVTYPLGRAAMVLSRSVHELIFALVFVAALGLGAFPGILALACRSVGFLSKTTAEAIENVDRGPIEAIEATGANRLSVIMFGIVPQVFPVFVGNVIFQLDINLRRAAILGMVGAGGIGILFSDVMMSYRFDQAGTCVLGIFIMVTIGEYVSTWLRTRLVYGGAGHAE
jgi:phosphonate transport system permease protein